MLQFQLSAYAVMGMDDGPCTKVVSLIALPCHFLPSSNAMGRSWWLGERASPFEARRARKPISVIIEHQQSRLSLQSAIYPIEGPRAQDCPAHPGQADVGYAAVSASERQKNGGNLELFGEEVLRELDRSPPTLQ